jgi:DNA modification methylase
MPRLKLVNRGGAGLLVKAGAADEAALASKVDIIEVKAGGKNRIAAPLRGLAVDMATLKMDPDNARVHGERNLQAIRDSLNFFGQMTPLVVRKQTMTIAAGNGRYQVAKELGWTRMAASIVPMTDAEFAGYAMVDNRSAELATWNLEVVKRVDQLLLTARLPHIGWSAGELYAMRQAPPKLGRDPDRVPEVPEVVVTQPGDIWQLGDHRLLCGDSGDAACVQRLMATDDHGNISSILCPGSLLVTDPPYGIQFGEANHNPRAKVWARIVGDDRQAGDLRQWFSGLLGLWLPFMRADAAYYVWTAPLQEGHRMYEAIVDAGLHIQGQIVWVKNVFNLGQADYQWKHEPCWYAFRKGAKHRWYGGRDKTTVWEIARLATSAYLHPAQKPVELYEIPMEHHTLPGDLVLEPFAGSGTQFIAATAKQRICYGMEIDPAYCDVTLERWSAYSGQDPVRLSDGRKWSELRPQAEDDIPF